MLASHHPLYCASNVNVLLAWSKHILWPIGSITLCILLPSMLPCCFIYLHCFIDLFVSCFLGKTGWQSLTVSVWCFWHSLLQHADCGTLHPSTAHLPTHILLLHISGHPPSSAGSPTASVPRICHWQYERAGKDSRVKAQTRRKKTKHKKWNFAEFLCGSLQSLRTLFDHSPPVRRKVHTCWVFLTVSYFPAMQGDRWTRTFTTTWIILLLSDVVLLWPSITDHLLVKSCLSACKVVT